LVPSILDNFKFFIFGEVWGFLCRRLVGSSSPTILNSRFIQMFRFLLLEV
jgi:hypothetical protein